MTQTWKRLFELKQDDWIDACKEIDQLKAQLAELGNEYAIVCHFKDQLAQAEVRNAQLVGSRDEWMGKADYGVRLNTQLQSRNAQLEKALKCWSDGCPCACPYCTLLARLAKELGEE